MVYLQMDLRILPGKAERRPSFRVGSTSWQQPCLLLLLAHEYMYPVGAAIATTILQ